MSDITLQGNVLTSYFTNQDEVLLGDSTTVVGGFLSFTTLGGSLDFTVGLAAAEVNIAARLYEVNMGYQFESSAGGGMECNLSPLGTVAPGLEYIGAVEVLVSSPPSLIELSPAEIMIESPIIMLEAEATVMVQVGGCIITVTDVGIVISSADAPVSLVSGTGLSIVAPEILMTGDVTIEGAVTVTGAVVITGDSTTTGAVSVVGDGTITGEWMVV